MTSTQDHRSIGVGIDGTEHSEGALRHALVEGRRRSAVVRPVHVEPAFRPAMPHVLVIDGDLEQIGKSILREAVHRAGDLAPDVVVKPWLRRGGRVHELVASAEHSQLMVVGRESMHGLDRLLLGTTTAGVAAHAPCPVHVVPEDWAEHEGPVVVGIHTLGQAEALVSEAIARAADRGRRVVVVHGWHLPDPYADRIETRVHAEEWRRTGEELLQLAIDPLQRAHPATAIEVRVSHADPVTALLDVPGASLIVVERAHRATWLPGSLGRTTRHLLARSRVPVEVVPVTDQHDERFELESSGSVRG